MKVRLASFGLRYITQEEEVSVVTTLHPVEVTKKSGKPATRLSSPNLNSLFHTKKDLQLRTAEA